MLQPALKIANRSLTQLGFFGKLRLRESTRDPLLAQSLPEHCRAVHQT